MRLLSLNIAAFEANNQALSEFLALQKVDILCLQEVIKKFDPTVNPDYITYDIVNKATPELKHSYFAKNWVFKDFHQKNFHKKESFDFEFGGFVISGNYIRSTFKITYKLNQIVKKGLSKITDWSKWTQNQIKKVQVVDLELPKSQKLRVINYHGIWTKEKLGNKETLRACQKILKLAKEVNYSTIIAGDFNLFPDTNSMKFFYKDFINLVDVYNIQTTRPKSNELSNLKRNVVDFILVSKDIKVNSFEVLESNVSDHLPLVMDFEI